MRVLGGELGRPGTCLPSPKHTQDLSPGFPPPPGWTPHTFLVHRGGLAGAGGELAQEGPLARCKALCLRSAGEWEECGAGGRDSTSVRPAGHLGACRRDWLGQGPASLPGRSARAPSGGCVDRGSGGQKQAAGRKAAEPAPHKAPFYRPPTPLHSPGAPPPPTRFLLGPPAQS